MRNLKEHVNRQAILTLCALLPCLAAYAGHDWFTARTVHQKTVPLSFGVPNETLQPRTKGDATPDGGLIDVVVSLGYNPAGDNNGQTQGNPGSEQDRVERIIGHFADGVYEMSEGGHKLRTLRIYRGAAAKQNEADAVWNTNGIPHVAGGGGVKMPGGHINMFDRDPRNPSAYTEEEAGYTLAHEWGHYFYGVYDEYNGARVNPPPVGSREVDPSIMNMQFNAAGGIYEWLNLSVRWRGGPDTNGNFGRFENTRATRQHDVFGESAWETLTRAPGWMESSRWFYGWPKALGGPGLSIGARVYYPELNNVAPQGTSEPVNQLPGTARSDLKILWMGTNSVIQIVIDRSGSMDSESKMQKAMEAAKNLVNAVDDGTAVGVIDFDDVVTTLYPITPVTSASTRSAIINAINTLYARNTTAIGDAARTALDGILAYNITNATAVVFLLTDGYSNTGSDPLSVIPNYQAAQVPIFGFGYGSTVDPRLEQMALETGGKYYLSPTTLAAVQRAFADALSQVQARPTVAAGQLTASSTALNVSIPFIVDPVMPQVRLTATYSSGGGGTILTLRGPDGTGYSPISSQQVGQETLLTFSVDNPGAGTWHLEGTLASNAYLVYQADASVAGFSYSLSAVSADGDLITSGSPIRIVANLSKDLAIAHADVLAVVTTPSGTATSLAMSNIASGTYFAEYYTGSVTGQYQVVVYAGNTNGTAAFTFGGEVLTQPIGGGSYVIPSDVPVGTNFSRVVSFAVQVKGGGGNIVLDVTADVTTTFNSWTLDRASGALIANITLRNDSGKGGLPLEKAFWYAITETANVRLATVSGYTNGMAFQDVTSRVEAQLLGIGNGDLRLDPGESVTFTVSIYSRDREIPTGHVFGIWADPPNVRPTASLTPKVIGREGNGHTKLRISGDIGVGCVIEASFNAVDWIPIGTVTNKTGLVEFTDRETAKSPQRYYRIRRQ